MRYPSLSFSAALACLLSLAAIDVSAQTATGEIWYQFAMQGVVSDPLEKRVTQVVIDMDPMARVLVDRESNILVVRTYQPLKVAALSNASAQYGITLALRNRTDIDGAIGSPE